MFVENKKNEAKRNKAGTIDHLKNISNQEAIVHWSPTESFTIKELINEVENETPVGREYINRWKQAITFIEEEL